MVEKSACWLAGGCRHRLALFDQALGFLLLLLDLLLHLLPLKLYLLGHPWRRKNGKKDPDHNAYDRQNTGDHAQNLADFSVALTRRIHAASRNFLEVRVPHDPSWNAKNGAAANEAEDAEDENESAAMWFHRLE